MKVSDEIRTWCGGVGTVKDLRALADRIDTEMVELPKDRDGVPIHVGDTVWDVRDGQNLSVIDIVMEAHLVRIHVKPDESVEWYVNPTDLTHTRPDSWERIADELDEQAGSLTKDGYTWQEDAIHDFAVRIRKLAKREAERS